MPQTSIYTRPLTVLLKMKLGELLTIEQNIIILLIDEILIQNINQYLSVHKKSSYFIISADKLKYDIKCILTQSIYSNCK